MISYLMTNNNSSGNQIKQFLPETTYDLSLNLSNIERHLSSDSIFTLDQEEYLEISSDNESKLTNQIPISIIHQRVREQTYKEEQGKSPTPTKYYKILEENDKLLDDFKN